MSSPLSFLLPKIIVYVCGVVGFAGLAWWGFDVAEKTSRDDHRRRLADTLRRLARGEWHEGPVLFANLFDCLFGRELFSWKSIRRSAVASLLLSIYFGIF